MITDCHSHFLPQIDDGAKSVDESIQMLKWSKSQGVDTMISTSHCYPKNEREIEKFLCRRSESYTKLKQALKETNETESVPSIRLGAEVNLITDISEFSNINQLCIEGTNYMLLEMPWGAWKDWMYDCVYSLTVKGIRPVMAHIERFFDREAEFFNLYRLDHVLYQVNADAFLTRTGRRYIKQLAANRAIHLIGSDTHNMTGRKSNIADAYQAIHKYFGSDYAEFITQNSYAVLNNEPVIRRNLKKTGFWTRLRQK